MRWSQTATTFKSLIALLPCAGFCMKMRLSSRRLDTLERKQLETDSKFMIFHGYSSVGRTKVASENGKALQEPETD